MAQSELPDMSLFQWLGSGVAALLAAAFGYVNKRVNRVEDDMRKQIDRLSADAKQIAADGNTSRETLRREVHEVMAEGRQEHQASLRELKGDLIAEMREMKGTLRELMLLHQRPTADQKRGAD